MRRLFCLLGDPVAHSRSPAIHARAFALLGLDAVYAPCLVKNGEVATAVAGLRALHASGFNVTVPHKGSVAALCDALTREAQIAGATNCVARVGDQLVGHNTDGPGLLRALRARGVSLDGRRALVLGAGGSARAAAVALAGRAREVNVVNRDAGKARTLSLQLRAAGAASRAAALDSVESESLLREADLIVHCTTVGMGTLELLIDPALLPAGAGLVDLVYAGAPGLPGGETALLRAARARGLTTIDGLDVLVYQAIASLELWLERPDLDPLFSPLREAALAANLHDAEP